MNRLCVVGGGFSGAVAAVHAIRAAERPLQIDVVEPRSTLGSGLAYSTPHLEHRLNVPSRRMSVFEDDPEHFHDWFVRTGLDHADPGSHADGKMFAIRCHFGRYVEALVAETVRSAAVGCTLQHRRTTAVDLERTADGWRVLTEDGGEIDADAVLICIGHSGGKPPFPFSTAEIRATGRVLTDPWDADAIARFGPDARILILGQGLTMGDVLSSLDVQEHRGPVFAVSRRGLMSRPWVDSVKVPVAFESLGDDARGSQVLRLLRDACDAAVRAGQPWYSVIETTRERGSTLWRRLSPAEQCRLLRHARVYWDAHRYRMTPQVAGVIERARRVGRLRLLAGRVDTAAPAADGRGIDVRLRVSPRSGGGSQREQFDLVVSCVGPTHDVATVENPFIQALLRRGFAEPHPTRLGFVVGRDNVLLRDGREIAGLHVLGPLSRGACGDVVAVPEISRQARAVVETLLKGPAEERRPGEARPSSVPTAAA